jgi:hypothetical protein
MSPNSPRSILHALILFAAVASAGPALAKAPKSTPESEAAKPMVTYRMVLMEDMAKTLKLANMVASGQVDRAGDLAAYAAALQSAPVGEVFPAGTGPDVVKTGRRRRSGRIPRGSRRSSRRTRRRPRLSRLQRKAGTWRRQKRR